jgi:pimeloyl-ACP methyl ester carboxylesterase
VADGTAGLTVIDLAVAGGSMDDDGDGIDDRVLGAVDLDGSRAVRVARYVDMTGRQIVAVAAGTGGVYLVQVAPTAAGLTLYDTNNIEVVPDAFKANDGTFVLVNDDNDDGAADASGAPILDLNKTGPVKGEHDLRRIDVSTPMSQGTVTIALESGSDHAKLWLSREKGDALFSPTSFDLGSGQRPPTTIWVEALAPSQADRDIVVLYRWSPPTGVAMEPIEDRVALTAVDVQFVTGRHGQRQTATARNDWSGMFAIRRAYAQSSGGDKQLFVEAGAEDIEKVLRGAETFDALPNATFGRVQIVGVQPRSVLSASVHTARGNVPDAGTVVDATQPSGATAFTMEAAGARSAESQQDGLLYQGTPLGLAPEALREATSAMGVLPVDIPQQTVAQTTAGVTGSFQTAHGFTKTLRRDPAKPAALQVIDAQEFAAEIVAFKEGRLSTEGLRQLYAEKLVSRDDDDMDGALADGASRLILRFETPNGIDLRQLVIEVAIDTAAEPGPVGNHFNPDAAFPFGSLTLTGFEFSSRALEVTTDPITTPDGRRVFVAVFTPPTSFPYVDGPEGAGRTLPLVFSVRAADIAPVDARSALVRPPVFLVHGLFGDDTNETWPSAFTANFRPTRFDQQRVNYSTKNSSGFDVIWREVRSQFRGRIDDYRNRAALKRKRIAATKVDAVAHSMGGLAVRWLATDEFAVSSEARSVTDAEGTQAGMNFPPLSTFRTPTEHYRQVDNFNDGDVRSLVAIGSPFGGSPLSNWMLHKGMGMDRLKFGVSSLIAPVQELATEIAAFAGNTQVATTSNDAGTGVIDLAIGSTATQALDLSAPGPLLVHAIATHGNSLLSSQFAQVVAQSLIGVGQYCSGFGRNTSDLVVPDGSAFYGTDAVGQSLFDGYDHAGQSKAPEVGKRIGKQLLYDHTPLEAGERSVNSFDIGFASEGGPFTCQ